MASTTRPASTGVLTASTADTTVSARNTPNLARCGPANPTTRLNVPRRTAFGVPDAAIALRIKPHVPSTTGENAQVGSRLPGAGDYLSAVGVARARPPPPRPSFYGTRESGKGRRSCMSPIG
ncbi:hypothetical protein GCM10010492_35630 [Saccharothrix mutabilis subsp. mutabilis]|uniref:Uncharacterized protein n=1 Tax=Saccharothrix mutabilis subsp. mutabilis TaxID=66855 RepID=A0ABN0TYT1_9PSEU